MTSQPPSPLRFASQNQLRSARRLLRRKERAAAEQFLAEGPQAVREALGRPGVVRTVLISQGALDRSTALLGTAGDAGVEVVLVSERDFGSLSETVSPQGVVAVCSMLDVSLLEALTGAPRLVVCCAQVRDPGNAGTVVRCADAFGADAVILTEGSVDAYNSKTVRATAGSLFHLPLVVSTPVVTAVDACRRAGLQVLAADASGNVDLDDLLARGQLSSPTAWVMGNEAWGMPADQLRLADQVVRVPLYGSAESLNLSTAAAVCLYATAAAQRSRRADHR